MIADVRSVVTSCAGSSDLWRIAKRGIVVQAANRSDLQRSRIEQEFAAGDLCSRRSLLVGGIRAIRCSVSEPLRVQAEHVRIERASVRIVAERIVNAWIVRLR